MPDMVVDGNVKVSFLLSIAAASKAPTVAELNAGTDLSKAIMLADSNLEGFKGTPAAADTTKLASYTSTSRPARVSYADPGFTFAKQSGASDTLFAALKGDGILVIDGFIVVRDAKPYTTAFAAADIVDVYPVSTKGYLGYEGRAASTLLRYEVKFMISGDVGFQVAVLA